MPDVVLRVDDKNHSGWTQIRVVRSMEQVLDTFSISLTDRWGESDEPLTIREGSPCEVLLDGERVITGYIDDVQPSYDAESHSISVSGRSKALDLVDCGLDGQEFRGKTLLQLAQQLAKPFGVKVSADTDVGAAFSVVRIEPGESGFEFLESLARQRAVRFVSDTKGDLHIINLGTEVIGDALELGVNILKASATRSLKNRYHKITVCGQQSGSNWSDAETTAVQKAEAIDEGVRTIRTNTQVAEDTADIEACKRRAEWQRNTAFGRGKTVNYTVKGWKNKQGLWQPNTRVPVFDRWSGFNGEELLIVSVNYQLGEQGLSTELALMPAESLELIALPEQGDAVTETWA